MVFSALARHGRAFAHPRPEHFGGIGKLGVFNFLNSIMFIWGLKLTSSFVTSVAQLVIPVITF